MQKICKINCDDFTLLKIPIGHRIKFNNKIAEFKKLNNNKFSIELDYNINNYE